MPLAKAVKKTIYIRPINGDEIKMRLVYVETTSPGDTPHKRSFYIPGSARAYQVVANHGDNVRTWIKNVSVLPNGQRVYSVASDPVVFDIPPIEIENVVDKPMIEVDQFPMSLLLPKDKDEFKKVCGVDDNQQNG